MREQTMDTASSPKSRFGFDREAFKLSLHNRSVQHANSARGVIIEGTGPHQSSPRGSFRSGAVTHRDFSQRLDVDASPAPPLSARERPTDRIRPAPNTEYVDKYCSKFSSQNRKAMFEESFRSTFNDRKLQRQTKVDIDGIPRERLKTSFVGWGPKMRQTYLPELKTDSLELHEHYKELGIAHGYKRAPSSATEKHPSSRPTTQASSTADYTKNMEATEYRGQFSPTVKSGFGTQTVYLPDGPLDMGTPGRTDALKLSIRQRRASSMAVTSRYKVMAENQALSHSMKRSPVEQYHAWMRREEGTAGLGSASVRKNTKIAVAQEDSRWQPPDHLRALTGKAGPTLLTAQRQGRFGVRLAQNPRKSTWHNYTRTHRRPHYSLAVSVEGQELGFTL